MVNQPFFSKKIHVLTFSIAVSEFVLFILVAALSWSCWHRTIRKIWQRQYSAECDGVEAGARSPTRFSYEQIQVLTNNFSEKLGSGAFGSVYKGMLMNKTLVAVKQLELATQGEKQFHAEVAAFGKIHHVNLVQLLGYCAEGNHRVLVYEFMVNGSLDKVLFSNKGDEKICDWNTRFTIATGVARGIAYLHEECQECILHCDIKPENILLDKDYCPKVSDFGMAKLLKREGADAYAISSIQGTRGYLAPEWICNKPITTKADVYSYGMVLLEILSGREGLSSLTSPAESSLTSPAEKGNGGPHHLLALETYKASQLETIADPELLDTVDWVQFKRVLKAAFRCTQVDANSRPCMSKVVQMLEGSAEEA